uniref:Mitotic spindle organizing protein 2B n=1 Tax=Equus asinus TaxID=9793 RepID=A0A9L0J7P2_EQUAS
TAAAQMAAPGAALQKLALRRKKVLSAEEMELYELAQAAGGAMDPDVFKILLDLLKLNLAPLAVFQMLKSTCAGQRLPSESQAAAAVSLLTSSAPETRGQTFLPPPHLDPTWPRPCRESAWQPLTALDTRVQRPEWQSAGLRCEGPHHSPE